MRAELTAAALLLLAAGSEKSPPRMWKRSKPNRPEKAPKGAAEEKETGFAMAP
jgi:hypothetical protein